MSCVPTRGDAILDLFLISYPEYVTSVNVTDMISDHAVVNVCTSQSPKISKKVQKQIFDFALIDNNKLNIGLARFMKKYCSGQASRSVGENRSLIKDAFQSLLNTCVPKIKVSTYFLSL